MSQPIRLSQFVTTYGPGAILEGPDGPRIIPAPDIGLFNGANAGVATQALEISDQRMSLGLLGGARIFRLPSNAELGVGDGRYLYQTRHFPSWSLCLNAGGHAGRFAVVYQARGCPVCGQQGQRRQQAIRFVQACANGHLDDCDWFWMIHRSGAPCEHRTHFRWYGIGGALSQIELECPSCGAREPFGRAYGREWLCGGRHPEREQLRDPARRPGCPEAARIVQRQASNLRLAELRTLFTIPPRSTRLHNLLQSVAVRTLLGVLRRHGPINQDLLRDDLEAIAIQNLLPRPTIQEIFSHPWGEILQAIDDVLAPNRTTLRELLDEEFGALLSASVHGAPPIHSAPPSRHVLFEVNRGDVVEVSGPNARQLRVTPVSRLRTVTVQVGYRREVPRRAGGGGIPASVVPVDFVENNYRWFPGAEFLGEGIFLTLAEEAGWHFAMAGPSSGSWLAAANRPDFDYPEHVFRTPERDELSPVFVWWHTLAHLLLRSVSIDSGYSSSAIRERVFIQLEPNSGRARGGLILYATQPGSEGTMGGLIALVPHFQRILDRAVDMARSCSNDPLCSDQHFALGRHNGPSCYGCLLVSETSCEHRNLWLDRELMQQNLP